MSTEAEGFSEEDCRKTCRICSEWPCAKKAAIANNEALIKAALEVSVKHCEIMKDYAEETYGVAEGVGADLCIRAIRQITPQQVMEKMK